MESRKPTDLEEPGHALKQESKKVTGATGREEVLTAGEWRNAEMKVKIGKFAQYSTLQYPRDS